MSTQPTFDLPLKPSPVYGDDIIDESGKTVVILFGDADSEETAAQRDLIVRAVNSYADMLSALKAIDKQLECPARNTNRGYRYAEATVISSDIRKQVKEAIAKAGGQ